MSHVSNMLFFFIGLWISNTLIDIPTWKMDSKCFEEAHADAIAKRKPLVTSATKLKAPFAPSEPSIVMTDLQSNYLISQIWKKLVAT